MKCQQKNPVNPYKFEDYGLRYLPSHLIEAEMWEKLEDVLTDLKFIEAKCAAGMTSDLIIDYNAVVDAIPEGREKRERKEELDRRVRRYVENLFAYAEGKTEILEIIPSVMPWSDDKIKTDTDRILGQPSRLDRIEAFARFVNAESHGLKNFGGLLGFCIQQAYNSADSGAVALAAENIVNEETEEILLLKSRTSCLPYTPHNALTRTFIDEKFPAACLDIDPVGNRAIIGGVNSELRVLDIETGAYLTTLSGHSNSVTSVCLSADARLAVSTSSDKTLRFWDIKEERCLQTLIGHPEEIRCVSMTPDGRIVVSGGFDNAPRVWDMAAGKCQGVLIGHTDWVTTVCIAPNGKTAVTGSYDQTVRLWNLETGKCIKTFIDHDDRISAICISSDIKYAVSGDENALLCVWNLETGECLWRLKGHTKAIVSLDMTADGKLTFSGSRDETIRIWNLETGACVRVLKGQQGLVLDVKVTPDGRKAVSVSGNSLRVWNIESGVYRHPSPGHTGLVSDVHRFGNNEKLLSGSWDGSLGIWNNKTGECIKKLKALPERVHGISLTPDDRLAVSIHDQKKLCLWDIMTEKCTKIIEDNISDALCVIVSCDGRRIILGGQDNNIQFLDIKNGKRLRILTGHSGWIRCLKETPDGKMIISGSGDNTLRLWNIETWKCLKVFEGHSETVTCVCIAPDGRSVISGDRRGVLKHWSLSGSMCIRTFDGHLRSIEGISVTLDGRWMISGSYDNTIRVWELETGKCIAIYHSIESVENLSKIDSAGHFAYGADKGQCIFMEPVNMQVGLTIVTPVRPWIHGNDGRWEEAIKARCPWCGKWFPVSERIIGVITVINRSVNLKPGQSPCLALPGQSWNKQSLLSECPCCNQILKYNPFIVDNREY